MKNNRLLCCLVATLLCTPLILPAQCGISVDAGEDIILCSPFTAVDLSGSIDGPYVKCHWEPYSLIPNPNSIITSTNVSQTTTFVLRARTDELMDNMIFNPDFELGNIGFFSSLDYGSLLHPDSYNVLTDPSSSNDAFYPCPDHTTGSGNMLAANISYSFSQPTIWCQTVQVKPHTDYYFSYWGNRISTPAKSGIMLRINGLVVSSMLFTAATPKCEWKNGNGIWNSGDNTFAQLCITNMKYANPVAIDDIFFAPFCETVDSVTVFVESVKAVAAPSLHPLPCAGYPIELSGAGSSTGPNFTYEWTTADGNIVSGHNTLNPIVDAPGTYTLTVSIIDGIGNCTQTASSDVEVTNALQAGISAPATLNCYTPNVLLQGFSSQPANSTYQWTASQGGNIVGATNNKNANANQAGDYTLVVTNTVTGCTAEMTTSIFNPVMPVANTGAAPITCAAPQTTLSGAGSSTGNNIVYAWSTTNGNITSGQTSQNATANLPGTYVLEVKNNLTNCKTTDTVVVAANNTPLEVGILPAGSITCVQNNVTLSADPATTGPHRTYSWTAIAGGNIVSGANLPTPVVNAPGLYIMHVTDTLSACSGVDTVAVAADNDVVVAIANAPAPLTCITSLVSLNADGSSPGVDYQWTTADGHIVAGANTPTPTVDAPGTYHLLLTNPTSGCTSTDVAVVDQNTAVPEVNIAPPPPLSCAQPLLTIIGQNSAPAGNYAYEWTASNGGHIFSGENTLMLCVDVAGTFTLHVTNLDNGCTATYATAVTDDFQAPDVDLTAPGTLNCNAPSVNLNNNSATNPDQLDHQWTLPDGSEVNTGSVPSLGATQPGIYSLLLSNTQNGCTATASVTVIGHEAVTADLAAQQNNNCFGAAEGSLGITAGGGTGTYNYLWSNDATTPSISGLAAGTYSVTVTDDENCSATYTALITEPTVLVPGASATPVTASGASDGSATATPQGGTAPYTFAWDNGLNTQTITDLAAGFYTVTVTDVNGCKEAQTVEVTSSDCSLLASIAAVDPLCHGSANGQATVLPNSGSAPYTYLWSSGSTEQTATGLAAGNYSVTMTDVNGCPFSGNVTLTEPEQLTLTVSNVENAVCPNSAEGSIKVQTGGGMGSPAIQWSNGQSGPEATGLTAGTYTATATDANGCTTQTSATVEAIDLEGPQIMAGPVNLPIGPSGSMELNLQNLGITVTDNCEVDTVLITPDEFDCFDLGTQQVTITAKDISGNTKTEVITVTFIDDETPVLECPASINRCAGNNIVEYAAPVAIDNCLILGGTFVLVNGLPSGSPFPQGSTMNTYTFTDVSGNTGACSFEVTILSPLAVSTDAIVHDVADQHIGSIQVSVSGSQPGYTYEWVLNGTVIATTEDLNGIGAGTYTLWVTDASGCKTEAGPFEVTSLVGTDSPDWADYIAVYPNPSSGRVFVVLPDELFDSEVRLTGFDATGKLVLEQNSSRAKQVEIDMSSLADGLYTVLIRTEQGQAARKITIHR